MKVKFTNESIYACKTCSIIHVTNHFNIFGSLAGRLIPYISLYPKNKKIEVCVQNGKYYRLIKK